jgi:hypothetical protein
VGLYGKMDREAYFNFLATGLSPISQKPGSRQENHLKPEKAETKVSPGIFLWK